MSHARRVLTHALAIAHEVDLAPVEREAVIRAASWHDVGRTHEGRDWTHGVKSVTMVLDLGLHEPHQRGVVDLAFFAMEYHAMWDHVGEVSTQASCVSIAHGGWWTAPGCCCARHLRAPRR